MHEIKVITVPDDGATVREQRKYIQFLENMLIGAIALLAITGSCTLACAMSFLT